MMVVLGTGGLWDLGGESSKKLFPMVIEVMGVDVADVEDVVVAVGAVGAVGMGMGLADTRWKECRLRLLPLTSGPILTT